MIKNIFLKSLCFIGLCLQAFPSSSGTDHAADGLREAFSGRAPFFAISVSRRTPDNDADYLPLTAIERFFVRSVLDMILNDGTLEFIWTAAKAALKKDLDQYAALKKRFIQLTNELTNDAIEEWLRGDGKVINAKNINARKIKEINRIKNENFTNLDQKFLDYWDRYFAKRQSEEVSSMDEEILSSYFVVWDKLATQISGHLRFFEEIKLSKAFGLIVFNEMFFGKNAPFPAGMIEREISQLSSEHSNKIFHANFLIHGTIDNQLGFIDGHMGSAELFQWNVKTKSYQDYISSLLRGGAHIKILENISKSYFVGNEVTYYRKSTYQAESDNDLLKDAFYVFGNGYDAKAPAAAEEIANVFMNNLATEICYDLHLGIRKQINSYPADLKIFVVPSNTLTFNDENIMKLPETYRSKVIFHVDPIEQEIFTSIPTISALSLTESFLTQYADLAWQKKESPLLVLQFELEGSLYKIKLWDIRHLMR